MKPLTLIPALAGLVALSPAALPVAARAQEAPATCAVQAGALRAAVESDYIGYRLALRNAPARAVAMTAAGERLTQEATTRDGLACLPTLQRYIAAFNDPHLFLADTPSDAGDLFNAAPPSDLRERALATAVGGDAILGLWSDGNRDIAVIPGDGGDIQAFALSADGAPAQLTARFVRTVDGYDATVRDDEGKAVRYPARVQKGLLLHMPPLTWVRRAPVTPLERTLSQAAAPRGPNFATLPGGMAVLSLPSFSPEHQPVLEELLATHRQTIAAAPLLIVDIRGNEGGNAGVGDLLAPFYLAEGRMESPPSRRSARVVASPGLIAHYERFIAYLKTGGYHDFLQRLVERMKASPGQLVPYGVDDRDWALMEAEPEAIDLAPGPVHIAILTDAHVVSAGEAFLLSAGRSPKVTIFGRNSAGSIDYESVYMTAVKGDGFRLRLGLPSVAGADTLPVGGLNDTGVPVDVELDPDATDVFGRIAAHYGL